MREKFIEKTLPVQQIGANSIKSDTISVKNIHPWFARRPQTASRAVSYAALIDFPDSEQGMFEITEMIKQLSKQKPGEEYITKGRENIRKQYGRPPRILDPFGGGGIIPLECQRLGCEVNSNDYNPVAVILQKCTIEYPQRHNTGKHGFGSQKLPDDIKKYGKRIQENIDKRLKKYFGDNETEYIWVRTIQCQNLRCGARIPLIPKFLIRGKNNNTRLDKNNTNVWLVPVIDNDSLSFKICSAIDLPVGFDRHGGTVDRGNVTCPICSYRLRSSEVNKLLRKDPHNDMLIAVAHTQHGKQMFRAVNAEDLECIKESELVLERVCKNFVKKYGFEPIPDEVIGTPTGSEYEPNGAYWVLFGPTTVGHTRWGHLFHPRQKLVMLTILDELRDIEKDIINECNNDDYSRCIMVYLGLALDRFVQYNNKITKWFYSVGHTANGIDGSAISIRRMYGEINPTNKYGSYMKRVSTVTRGLELAMNIRSRPAKVTNVSASRLPYGDGYFDAIFTDPPYYDMKSYSDLSDFYYVWLKRSIGHLFPNIFKSILAPKSDEIIVNESLVRNADNKAVLNIKTKFNYEQELGKAFTEMYRVLRNEGICVIIYSHTTIGSWEAVINALNRSSFVITTAWPINSENPSRQSALRNSSVQSTIYMVCRKQGREDVGYWINVKRELDHVVPARLDQIKNCILYQDYLIAAIGFGLSVITKYNKVTDDSGEEIAVRDILTYVRKLSVDHVLSKFLDLKLEHIDSVSRMYVYWRYVFGTKSAPYDDARKLCEEGFGLNISSCPVLKKEKKNVLLLGAHDRPFEKITEDNLIDIIHKALVLIKTDKLGDAMDLLRNHEMQNDVGFEVVVHAIANTGSQNQAESKEMKRMFESLKPGLITHR